MSPERWPAMTPAPITETEARITHVRGTGFSHLRATLKVALYGGRWDLLMDRLSAPARALLDHPPALEDWIDAELLLEIHLAQQDLPHPDTRKVRGELTAEAEMKRMDLVSDLSRADPRALILRFVYLWPETNRGGCVTIDRLTDGEGELSVWGTFPYPEYLRDVGPAWVRQAISMAGARDAKVDYLGPGPEDVAYRHRYWMKWTPVG